MPHIANQLSPGNSNLVWVEDVVDDADPEDEDGNPNWIDTAVVTWGVYTGENQSGVLVASGTGVSAGSGKYLITLSHTIAILAGEDYYLHVHGVTLLGYVFDLDWAFSALLRTGETPVT